VNLSTPLSLLFNAPQIFPFSAGSIFPISLFPSLDIEFPDQPATLAMLYLRSKILACKVSDNFPFWFERHSMTSEYKAGT
jgi:hypothetical protein